MSPAADLSQLVQNVLLLFYSLKDAMMMVSLIAVSVSLCLSVSLSLCFSLSVTLSLYLFLSFPHCRSMSLFVSLSFCLFLSYSLYLSLSLCLFIPPPPICLSVTLCLSQVLQQSMSSRQSLDLSQVMKVRSRVVCSQQLDATSFTLSWSSVCPLVSVDIQPVQSLPVIPTALLRSLTSTGLPYASSRQRG